MIIQDNAIFIADAHYNANRTDLHQLLMMLQNETLSSKQIFLMGDIFDFLASQINYFVNRNSEIISTINQLSKTHDIIYLEGNHDFNILDIFPLVNVIPRQKQPISIQHNNKKISLAHGDIFTPFAYNLYTSIIRNTFVLNCINFLDVNNFISKFVEKKLMNKKICHKQDNFKQFIRNRIDSYSSHSNTDLIIEGHFHQGHIEKQYINIPSLACGNRYMVYKNNQFSFNTL